LPAFVRLQLFWLAVSLSIPAICMALALTGSTDPLLLSDIALPSLLSCWILALLTPFAFGGNASRELRRTSLILAWSAIAIIFPLIWDLPWAIFHSWVYSATAGDHWKWFFWAYAVADTRFLQSDPIMIIVEYWSGVIGVIEILFLRSLLHDRLNQALRLLIMAGSFQFYGCTVFFLTEVMKNFSDIRPTAVSYVKFFGLNSMWMVVPAISAAILMLLLKDPAYSVKTTLRQLFGTDRPAARSEDPAPI
jgi:hypothetical protein